MAREPSLLSDVHVYAKTRRSRFQWCTPRACAVDEDGDLDVARIGEEVDGISESLTILHANGGTTLDQVGLQVWTGSVMLCDWIWRHRGRLVGRSVLVLGCGCGVEGLLAAKLGARRVFQTDCSTAALANCRENLRANFPRAQSNGSVVAVRHLCWGENALASLDGPPPFGWRAAEAQALRAGDVDLILAADVVYDVACVEPLLDTIRHVLLAARAAGGMAEALLSLENRIVCTVAGVGPVDSSAYHRFRELLLPSDAGVVRQDGRPWQEAGPCELVACMEDVNAVPRATQIEPLPPRDTRSAAKRRRSVARLSRPDTIEVWRLDLRAAPDQEAIH